MIVDIYDIASTIQSFIIAYIYIVMILILFYYLNFNLYTRLNYHPLLERSSKLMMLSLNFMLMITLYLPFTLLTLVDDNSNNQLQFIKYFTRNIKIIDSSLVLIFGLHTGFQITQVTRGIRIFYVFVIKEQYKILDVLFKNEFYLIFLILVTTLAIILSNLNELLMIDQANNFHKFAHLKISITFCTNLLLLLVTYHIRNIQDFYNISNELIIIFFIEWFQDCEAFLKYFFLKPDNEDFWKIYYGFAFIIHLQNYIQLYFQIIVPLSNSQKNRMNQFHYLTISDLKFFLNDHQRIVIFYNFIRQKYQEKIDLLLYYLECQQQNNSIEQFSVLEQLSPMFEQYKLTKSFEKLKLTFKEYYRIQERLYEFNMNDFSIQQP